MLIKTELTKISNKNSKITEINQSM